MMLPFCGLQEPFCGPHEHEIGFVTMSCTTEWEVRNMLSCSVPVYPNLINGFHEMTFSAQQSMSQRRRIGELVTSACGLVCTVQDWEGRRSTWRLVRHHADRTLQSIRSAASLVWKCSSVSGKCGTFEHEHASEYSLTAQKDAILGQSATSLCAVPSRVFTWAATRTAATSRGSFWLSFCD